LSVCAEIDYGLSAELLLLSSTKVKVAKELYRQNGMRMTYQRSRRKWPRTKRSLLKHWRLEY